MADITLQQAQQMVDAWIKTYGVRYFNELTNMTILTEEVGELARIMARTYGEQSFKESDKHRDLGDEMADVLWVLLCLANQTGVDLTLLNFFHCVSNFIGNRTTLRVRHQTTRT